MPLIRQHTEQSALRQIICTIATNGTVEEVRQALPQLQPPAGGIERIAESLTSRTPRRAQYTGTAFSTFPSGDTCTSR
jgi:hypothetical protein